MKRLASSLERSPPFLTRNRNAHAVGRKGGWEAFLSNLPQRFCGKPPASQGNLCLEDFLRELKKSFPQLKTFFCFVLPKSRSGRNRCKTVLFCLFLFIAFCVCAGVCVFCMCVWSNLLEQCQKVSATNFARNYYENNPGGSPRASLMSNTNSQYITINPSAPFGVWINTRLCSVM